MPAEVELDIHGRAVVTATAQKAGAITALPGDVSQIATPTRGWQSVTNPEAATAGKPVETDAELRQRQALSVALPSRTVMEGLIGAIANITGVTRYKGYDNDTSETDINGVPAHAVSMVVDGGDAEEIARIIAIKITGCADVRHYDGDRQRCVWHRQADPFFPADQSSDLCRYQN